MRSIAKWAASIVLIVMTLVALPFYVTYCWTILRIADMELDVAYQRKMQALKNEPDRVIVPDGQR
jgi:hypothetical protein